MEPSKTILSAEGVSVAYAGIPVIQDISFEVHRGETFGLIGLNGAGKTSFIKTILGLREVHSGEVKVFDQSPSQKQSRSSLAYLPERFDPPWFLSGMEFIKFSLKIYKKEFDRDRVLSYTERLALDPAALKRRVQTYSKGMRQKLGLLATLLTHCQLMVLDEPMSGLDPKARTLVKDFLLEERSHDNTIFLSSHILSDLDEICDRVAVIHDGRLQFVGKPQELKDQTGSENLERAFLHYIEKPEAA